MINLAFFPISYDSTWYYSKKLPTRACVSLQGPSGQQSKQENGAPLPYPRLCEVAENNGIGVAHILSTTSCFQSVVLVARGRGMETDGRP